MIQINCVPNVNMHMQLRPCEVGGAGGKQSTQLLPLPQQVLMMESSLTAFIDVQKVGFCTGPFVSGLVIGENC